ncbi:MAG: hypothetical protein J0M08_08935 [Bacteroidetes bacterium]|nr:hypothetical protein [Bacteroidota bacterium]
MNSLFQLKNNSKRLTAYQEKSLLSQLKNSPKQKVLFNLLKAEQLPNTNAAIKKIYEQELLTTSFKVAQNRFYKLKQLLNEQLVLIQKADTTEQQHGLLNRHELLYYTCRKLYTEGNYLLALEQLTALEQELIKAEIFELLYLTQDLQHRCLQHLGKFEACKVKVKAQEQSFAKYACIYNAAVDDSKAKLNMPYGNTRRWDNVVIKRKKAAEQFKESKRLKLIHLYSKLELYNYKNSIQPGFINTSWSIHKIDALLNKNNLLCMNDFGLDYLANRDRDVFLQKIMNHSNFPNLQVEYDDDMIKRFAGQALEFNYLQWLIRFFMKMEDWKNCFFILEEARNFGIKNNSHSAKLITQFRIIEVNLEAFPSYLPPDKAQLKKSIEEVIANINSKTIGWEVVVGNKEYLLFMIVLNYLICSEKKEAIKLIAGIKIKNKLLASMEIAIHTFQKLIKGTLTKAKAIEQLEKFSEALPLNQKSKKLDAIIRIVKARF